MPKCCVKIKKNWNFKLQLYNFFGFLSVQFFFSNKNALVWAVHLDLNGIAWNLPVAYQLPLILVSGGGGKFLFQ